MFYRTTILIKTKKNKLSAWLEGGFSHSVVLACFIPPSSPPKGKQTMKEFKERWNILKPIPKGRGFFIVKQRNPLRGYNEARALNLYILTGGGLDNFRSLNFLLPEEEGFRQTAKPLLF